MLMKCGSGQKYLYNKAGEEEQEGNGGGRGKTGLGRESVLFSSVSVLDLF